MGFSGPTFDRTYEGLKRGGLLPGAPGGGPFDRTYEGLKQVPGPFPRRPDRHF